MRPTVDYVEHLNDFVDFHSASFPFQNGATTVVIPAKDDIVGPHFDCCYGGIDCEYDVWDTIDNGLSPPNDNSYDYFPSWNKRTCRDQNYEPIPAVLPVDPLTGDPICPTEIHYEYGDDGVLLRGGFRRHCTGEPAGKTHDMQEPCSFVGPGSTTDYYTWRFWISLDSFAQDGRLGHLGLSAQNYNYRIRDIALNFVGYDLLDCNQAANPSSCYSTTFVPYDLIQTGTVKVRDHSLVPHDFRLPRGGVRGGKALAAERFVTSPIASSDMALLSQYWAREFKGRPLQGEYELRIYQTDAFQWDELEDVQVVVVLDYWSPFEAVPW